MVDRRVGSSLMTDLIISQRSPDDGSVLGPSPGSPTAGLSTPGAPYSAVDVPSMLV